MESRKGFFGGCKRPKPAEENRLGISNGAEKSNSRRFQTAWVDQIQCRVDGISISCFLVPRGRERSVDEEVAGFLWCVVGGRKQPY